MRIKVILYGVARDIIGTSCYDFTTSEAIKVDDLLKTLCEHFPRLSELSSLLVAVNDEYADKEYVIGPEDEVVLIPPVSGG